MNKMLLIICFMAMSHSNAASLNSELIINGGAENGDTTGWVSTGIEAVVPLFLPAALALQFKRCYKLST